MKRLIIAMGCAAGFALAAVPLASACPGSGGKTSASKKSKKDTKQTAKKNKSSKPKA